MTKGRLARAIAALLAWVIWMLPAPMASAEAAEANPADGDMAEWTVMFYPCGSDLESRYGFATGNLLEILDCTYPYSLLPELARESGVDVNMADFVMPGKVNVLIETGGSSAWQIDRDIMNVDTASLQRWRYEYFPPDGGERGADSPQIDGFRLAETLSLASMADPETLADFIRWGAEVSPARKYALVLWDHGGGSKTGILADELFDGDTLYLDELGSAMRDGGVRFEAVLMDACMMANMETACAISDSAHWLIASEEVVAGQGTDVNGWLQELFYNPSVDGLALGRNICDMTQMKYANLENEQARQNMTWSVIDLSRIGRVAEQFDLFFKVTDTAVETYPALVRQYASFTAMSQEYGNGGEDMRDLAYLFYDNSAFSCLDYDLRRNMQRALNDAVAYVVRGAGRSAARGLSYCCATNFTPEELDIYARNCPSPHYLAFLDAVSPWEAPDRVYETAPRLQDVDTLEAYRITVRKHMGQDGLPWLYVDYDSLDNLGSVTYNLYQKSAATGQLIWLGRTFCVNRASDEMEGALYSANDPMRWPAIDGVPCCIDLIKSDHSRDVYVYDIPVQIGRERSTMRCGRTMTPRDYVEADPLDIYKSTYEIYGIWDGYDEDTRLPNRNVKTLAQLAGQEYRMLYPLADDAEGKGCEAGPPLTMYRALDIGEATLPAGAYCLEYVFNDLFGRAHPMERVEMVWDGETITYPGDFTWEGEVTLNARTE